jgi:hypothetical protein
MFVSVTMRMLIFAACLLACCAYAFARGGRAEKVGAVTLLVGSVLSAVAMSPAAARFATVEVGVLMVDLAVLAIFIALALTTDRFWPLWVSALPLIGVLAHAARLADPEMMRNGYAFLLAVWSYPMLLAIALGTRAYHRRERGRTAAPI